MVLVRPHIAANLGAVARVMRNFGFSDLVLVAAAADPLDAEARKLSTHGEAILRQARVVGELAEAVAECVLVAGTSARTGGPFRTQSETAPDQIAAKLVEAAAAGPVALVFGPEASGLSNDEVSRCHHLIHIPARDDYPALNLAQAVAICLYELRRAQLRRAGPSAVPAIAPQADQERMFQHLRQALEEVHYLYGANADALMHGIRHLIGRARPSPVEVDLLFGLARQLRWYVARHSGGSVMPQVYTEDQLRDQFLHAMLEATYPLQKVGQDQEVTLHALIEATQQLKERFEQELDELRQEKD
jgi:tRNA/rRNA methyltransferase